MAFLKKITAAAATGLSFFAAHAALAIGPDGREANNLPTLSTAVLHPTNITAFGIMQRATPLVFAAAIMFLIAGNSRRKRAKSDKRKLKLARRMMAFGFACLVLSVGFLLGTPYLAHFSLLS